jgi:hypothetical protein
MRVDNLEAPDAAGHNSERASMYEAKHFRCLPVSAWKEASVKNSF